MKLSILQLTLLKACRKRSQPSTAQIQNQARALVKRGLVMRAGRPVYLRITQAGLDVLGELEPERHDPPCAGDPKCRTHQGGRYMTNEECRR